MNPGKFRRLQEVIPFLDKIKAEIQDLVGIVQLQKKLLAKSLDAATAEFEVTPTEKSDPKVALAPVKVVVPDKDKLQRQYELMETLNDRHVLLESTKAQVLLQFDKNSKDPLFKQTMASIESLLTKVDECLLDVVNYLNKIANKYVPSQFTDFTEKVFQSVLDVVLCKSNRHFVYASVSGNNVVFTDYLLLEGAVNSEGHLIPALYVAIHWNKDLSLFIEYEFVPPNRLKSGAKVSSADDAVKKVINLLSVEGFAAAIGNLPIELKNNISVKDLKPSMFRGGDWIRKISVDEDQLTFTFHKGLTTAQKSDVAYNIFVDLKAMLKRNKAKVRMLLKPNFVTLFIQDVAKDGQISVGELEFLQTKFGIDDGALAKISRILNSN